MENEKCFCHFNGYEVKDAKARKEIEELKNLSETPMFLSVFFKTSDEKPVFYISNDLKKYHKLDINYDFLLRDGSICEFNNEIYIVKTYNTENADFMLIKTSDFKTFNEIPINLGLDKNLSRWAPSIKVIDDKLIVTISLVDKENNNSYIYKTESELNTISFTDVIKIELGNDNIIDSDLFKYNNKYYLLAKDETNGNIRLYKSSNNVSYEFVRILDEFPSNKLNKNVSVCEGAFGLNLGNDLFIGCDNVQQTGSNSSLQLGFFTEDIEIEDKNTKTFYINGPINQVRHGSTIMVESYLLKCLLLSKISTFRGDYEITTPSIQYVDEFYATNNVIEDLYVFPNCIYKFVNNLVTINRIHNPFKCDFNIMFAGSDFTGLKMINNGKIDKNWTIRNSREFNEKILKFIWTDDGYFPEYYTYNGLQNTYSTIKTGNQTQDVLSTNRFFNLQSGNTNLTLNGIVNDVYFYVPSNLTGTFTLNDINIDLSTIPAKSLIHFKYNSDLGYVRVV